MLAGKRRRLAGEILEAFGSRDHVDLRGLLDRLAGVERLEPREVGVACAEEIGDAAHRTAALGAGHRRPHRLAAPGRRDGALHLRAARDLDHGERLAGRRVDRGEGLGPRRVDIGAADMVPDDVRSGEGCTELRVGWPHLRRPRDFAVDEGARDFARGTAVALLRRGERGAEPQPVDHRREPDGDPLGVRRRHDAAERVAKIGEHARLVDVLHAAEPGRMDDLSPEGEPDAARARLELLGRQCRVDDRLDALARAPRRAEPRRDAARQPPGEVAERRLEEAVLVVEIVRNQPRRDLRPLADEGERGGVEARLGERVDRRLDQLPATKILAFDPAQATFLLKPRLARLLIE